MSRATSDDQLKFLLSCVRYSNNGKIDFIEVAKECGVVSKGAAAKRYERLLKANGIHPSGGPAEKSPSSTPRPKTKADITKSAAAKRRKIEGDAMYCKVDDEDDFNPYFKHEAIEMPYVKPEPGLGQLTYSAQHLVPSAQQPFGVRPFMAPTPIHNPYTMPFPQPNQYPNLQRFRALPEQMHSVMPQPSPQIQHIITSPNQEQHPPIARITHSVSEEQMDSMFAEFCAQDMLKSSNHDSLPMTQSMESVSATVPVVSELPVAETHVSPNTVEHTMAEPSKVQTTLPPIVKEEPTAQDDTTTVQQPSGDDIENSILITD